MKKRIVIITPFNTMGFSTAREHDVNWIRARLEVMQNFTALSLFNQTNNSFDWHILIREETKNFINSIYKKSLNEKLVTEKESEELLIKICEDAHPTDLLLLVRLNSDDCYHKKFIETLFCFGIKRGTEALVFQKGFMWYQKENILVERSFPSPPFYAFVYKPKEFLNGKRYDVTGHNYIRKELQSHALKEFLWLWIVNDLNNKILRGSSYPDPKEFEQVDNKIIKEFI